MEAVESGGGAAAAEDEGPAAAAALVADVRWPNAAHPLRLLEWKVKPGSLVNVDSVLALCAPADLEAAVEAVRVSERKLKSGRAGTVRELCFRPGQLIPPGWVTPLSVPKYRGFMVVLSA